MDKNRENLSQEDRDYLEVLFKENPDLVTPGARKYFHRVIAGYIVLAVAFAVGVWAMTARTDKHLRGDINTFASQSCVHGSIKTIQKFNDFVEGQIDTERNKKIVNLSMGNKAAAAVNQDAIDRYKKDKLHVPTIKECNRKILK